MCSQVASDRATTKCPPRCIIGCADLVVVLISTHFVPPVATSPQLRVRMMPVIRQRVQEAGALMAFSSQGVRTKLINRLANPRDQGAVNYGSTGLPNDQPQDSLRANRSLHPNNRSHRSAPSEPCVGVYPHTVGALLALEADVRDLLGDTDPLPILLVHGDRPGHVARIEVGANLPI